MAISYAKFFPPTVLTLSVATIYVVPVTPASSLLRSGRVRITNTTVSAVSAQLYAVPAAGTASATNAFFYNQTIPANGFIDVDVPIMAAGDFIQATASATPGVNIQAIAGGIFSS